MYEEVLIVLSLTNKRRYIFKNYIKAMIVLKSNNIKAKIVLKSNNIKTMIVIRCNTIKAMIVLKCNSICKSSEKN